MKPTELFSGESLCLMGLDILGDGIERLSALICENEFFLQEEEWIEVRACRIAKRKNEKRAGKMAVKRLLSERIFKELGVVASPSWFLVLADSHPVRLSVSAQVPLDFRASIAEVLLGTHASIAHSGHRVLAGVSSTQVGVDLEVLRELRQGTISYFCSKEEVLWVERARRGLAGLSQELSQKVAPLVLFTQKEAILKAEGKGVAGGFEKVKLPSLVFSQEFLASYEERNYEVLTLFEGQSVVSLARGITLG
jgi:hypothetical protein